MIGWDTAEPILAPAASCSGPTTRRGVLDYKGGTRRTGWKLGGPIGTSENLSGLEAQKQSPCQGEGRGFESHPALQPTNSGVCKLGPILRPAHCVRRHFGAEPRAVPDRRCTDRRSAGAVFKGTTGIVLEASLPEDRVAMTSALLIALFAGLSVPVIRAGIALDQGANAPNTPCLASPSSLGWACPSQVGHCSYGGERRRPRCMARNCLGSGGFRLDTWQTMEQPFGSVPHVGDGCANLMS